MIRQLLRKKWFLVKNIPVLYTNYILTNFDILSVNLNYKQQTFEELQLRVKKHHFFYRPPIYLEFNHKTMTCLIIQKFVKRNMLNILLHLKVKLYFI